MNARYSPLLRCHSLRHVFSLVALCALTPTMLPPGIASACIWDYDTLRQERSRFPETLELITGKFLRHSPEFYEWRIKDRLEKLKAHPANLAYHDDLAVAYSKVGRTKDAVAVMEAKEKIKPGVYETYSNLGTFYILAGELEKGLPYIDKALAINPEAHFGREKYQKWLVEWALTCRQHDGKLVFPLARSNVRFIEYIEKKNAELPPETKSKSLHAEALKGVLGMMRFANHDNPLLLEALAHLTLHHRANGQRLAARAYLLASYGMKDDEARDRYRKLADESLGEQKGSRDLAQPHPNIEDDFKAELADAARWYSELRDKELAWIRDGKNVDEEFDRLYNHEPRVKHVAKSEHFVVDPLNPAMQILVGVALAAVVALALTIRHFVRRSRNRTPDQPASVSSRPK